MGKELRYCSQRLVYSDNDGTLEIFCSHTVCRTCYSMKARQTVVKHNRTVFCTCAASSPSMLNRIPPAAAAPPPASILFVPWAVDGSWTSPRARASARFFKSTDLRSWEKTHTHTAHGRTAHRPPFEKQESARGQNRKKKHFNT